MADRTRQVPPAPTRTRSAPTSASVRRNLFQSQLTRRPTPSSSNNSAETLRLETEPGTESSSEIVVRDRYGDFEIGDAPSPLLDDPEEAIVVEGLQETEKERQRLAEAVKHHQINHSAVASQPEELLEAVRASLRAKVTALSEDNWMFESETSNRP